jgi:O-antigen/teichoic acid export membrane protein
MLGKKISQNFAINILSMAFGFISSIFIARIGGPTILGNISLAMSFQVLIKSIFTHTVNSAHLKIYSEDNSVGLKSFLVVNIFYNVVTSLLVVFFVVWNHNSSAGTFTELQTTLIVIFILQDYLFTPLYIYVTDQQSKLNILRANMVDFSAQTFVNIAKIAAVLLGESEIGIAWWMMGACGVSGIYPLVKLIQQNFGTYSFSIAKKYIRYSLHISTSTIAYGLLLSFDKVLLGLYAVPAAAIGYYNVGNRLGLMIMTLGVSVGGIFLSVFAKNITDQNHDKTREQLAQYERFIAISFLPAFLAAILFGKELIIFVFGDEYILAYPVLIFALFMAYIKTVTIPLQNYLFANNRFKSFNRISIAFAISILTSTLAFGYFNFFNDLTVSVAAGLFFATVIERFLFVVGAKQVDSKIQFAFHPMILFFFSSYIAGWFMIDEQVSEFTIILSYGIRIGILLSILPLGLFFGIYTKADIKLITNLIGK